MKRYLAPKESDSTDLLNVFLYVLTWENHTHGQGILWFLFLVFVQVLCKAIYFIHIYKISCLSCACLSVVFSRTESASGNCSILVVLPVQSEWRVQSFLMEGFSRTLPCSCMHTTCNIQCHSSYPQWWHWSVQGQLSGMWGALVVFNWLLYYCVTVVGPICWGIEMCLFWQIVCFCHVWDNVTERGGQYFPNSWRA